MIVRALQHIVDLFFRIFASQFIICDDSEQDGSHPESHIDDTGNLLTADFLGHFQKETLVQALEEFSFSETLTLLSGLSPQARSQIFAALSDHHDLKAAIEFGLQYEEPGREGRQSVAMQKLSSVFLERLESSTPSSSRAKQVSGENQTPKPSRPIDLLTKRQLERITELESELSTRIVAERAAKPFTTLEDLGSRIQELNEEQLRDLARFF